MRPALIERETAQALKFDTSWYVVASMRPALIERETACTSCRASPARHHRFNEARPDRAGNLSAALARVSCPAASMRPALIERETLACERSRDWCAGLLQ